MKKTLVWLTVLFIITGVGVVFLLYNQSVPQDNPPSDEDFIQTITQEFPFFLYDDRPIIGIESVSRHDGNWYIVTITSLRSSQKSVPVKLIMTRVDNTLKTIIGPDTHFTESEMMSYNLPDSVILELQES